MKKYLLFAAAALAAFSFTACQEKNGPENGKEDESFKKIARITKMGDYVFSYNDNGTVASVVETWGDGPDDCYALNFVYNGTSLKINDSEATVYEVTLNDKGLATAVKNCADNVTYTYEYDNAGFCVKCKKDGADQCQQSINDNCVDYWTRMKKKDDGTFDHWRHKEHSYNTAQPNLGGVHTEWAEDFGQKRWFYETGLLGRASEYVCATAQWDDAEKLAKYEYEYDANGLITKETKYYGKDGAMDFDDEKTFEWELLK